MNCSGRRNLAATRGDPKTIVIMSAFGTTAVFGTIVIVARDGRILAPQETGCKFSEGQGVRPPQSAVR